MSQNDTEDATKLFKEHSEKFKNKVNSIKRVIDLVIQPTFNQE